ncbi:MAG: arginine--tRNA ligase [Planctomycetes bacterium]|nr:arginine--tRNA ligase [Planctomycetota bacterium]
MCWAADPMTAPHGESTPAALRGAAALPAKLDAALRSALVSALGEAGAAADPALKAATQPRFGDFQANFAMGLAKSLGRNPRELAQEVLAAGAAALEPLCEKLEVAGPGFVNISLRPSIIADALQEMDNDTLGVPTPGRGRRVAVDLCGVNVAKQLHVGHLRASIIGDSMARLHERLGWTVFRQNHLGDWGLPIAMTLASLERAAVDLSRITLDDLNRAYRRAQAEGRDDEAGLAAARETHAGPHRIAELEAQHEGASALLAHTHETLRRLQGGDQATVAAWQRLIAVTMREVFETAATLGVLLDDTHSRGESFFRDQLAPTVDAFVQAGLAERDQGALIVRFADRERPLLIQKSDGTSLYATTDLAAAHYRIAKLGAERVIYCVDARQRDHFRDVFDAIHAIGWDRLPSGRTAEMIHVAFGAVLGADKRPLKTRSGENFTLKALLDEAVGRGQREVRARAQQPDAPTAGLQPAELDAIGQAVGIAAIKYADLSSDVSRDYVFDLDRMVSFEGETGPYAQYAHARITGILAKAGASSTAAPLRLAAAEERALALMLLRYAAAVQDAAEQCAPNRLAAFIFELANAFNAFYQSCPVIKEPDAVLRASRLRLCDITRRVIADALSLLGIAAPDRM